MKSKQQEKHSDKSSSKALKWYQWTIFATLFVGYATYAYNRKSVSLALPQLMQKTLTKSDAGKYLFVWNQLKWHVFVLKDWLFPRKTWRTPSPSLLEGFFRTASHPGSCFLLVSYFRVWRRSYFRTAIPWRHSLCCGSWMVWPKGPDGRHVRRFCATGFRRRNSARGGRCFPRLQTFLVEFRLFSQRLLLLIMAGDWVLLWLVASPYSLV